MIALNKKQHSDLVLFCRGELKVNNPLKRAQLIQWRDQVALASLMASPEMYANCIEVCDSYGPEIERRVYPDLLSAMKSKEDHGGVVLELFTAPPVPEIKLPEKLPCDVSVSPNVVFRKGVNTQVLLNCLIRKSNDSNGLGD